MTRKLTTALAAVIAFQPPPTFRAGTTLVEFTVAAIDDRGNPVSDLRKDEIAIVEQGQPRDVAFFQYIGGSEGRTLEPLPEGLFTNRSEYSAGPPRHVTAIVLDAINVRPADQLPVRTQLLRYLDTIPRGTRVALYQVGWRLTVVHDFTSDFGSLRRRISTMLSGAPVDPDVASSVMDGSSFPEASELLAEAIRDMRAQDEGYQESAADRKRALTLASLEALGNSLAGIPGRKTLVWITAETPIASAYRGYVEIHERQFRQTAQRLASRGITVYPVDAIGLKPPNMGTASVAPGSSRGQPPQASLPDQRSWATMNLMADVTGGRFSHNTNDMSEGVKAAALDERGTYTIGFYAAGAPDDKWHQLKVTTKRRGVRVSHRLGYLSDATPPQPLQWNEGQWRTMLARPIGSTVIHVDARFEPVPKAAVGTYEMLLLISPAELHFRRTGDQLAAEVEIVVAEKRPNGAFSFRIDTRTLTVAAGVDTAGTVLRYVDRWTVKPGTSSIRLAVRDRFTSRYGTLDIPTKQLPGGPI